MAYTDAQLTAIRSAIAKGELEVEFSDRRVRYRSIEELLKAEERIAGSLRTNTRPKQLLGVACKGL